MRRPWVQSSFVFGTSLMLIAACSASGGGNQGLLPAEQTPAGGGGPGTAGGANDPVVPGVSGNSGFDLGGDLGEPVAAPGCQQAQREFDPKIPTVFMLVDRSDTMFAPLAGGNNVTPWAALRVGALQVMRELESSVSFGFGAFAGGAGAATCNYDFQSVPPALGNYAAIESMYGPLDKPVGLKETPTLLALTDVVEQLRAAPGDSDKYILFVTDGEPDYCDDGPAACPADSVIAALQRLAAPEDAAGQPQVPIQTLVLGITAADSIRPAVLQAFANAGSGAPVAPLITNPNQPYNPDALYYDCQSRLGWQMDLTAIGKPLAAGQSVATYATDPALAGTAPVYAPDLADQAALIEQIRVALSGVKSCTFDLAADGVQVDRTRTDLGERAHVIVNGNPVALDMTNGWHMLTETTVQLEGEACAAWRSPTVETTISFDFPCDIFVPL